MKSQVFEFQIEGKTIPVTREEVVAFYGSHYGLSEEDITGYTQYVASIKHYKECERWLDKVLVRQLIEEERLMKIGEADGFKLQLTFEWYVELKRENIDDFRYTLNAYCLDNPQTFCRRYMNMEAALLHCLNSFNENARLPNRYHSIKDYLNKTTK